MLTPKTFSAQRRLCVFRRAAKHVAHPQTWRLLETLGEIRLCRLAFFHWFRI